MPFKDIYIQVDNEEEPTQEEIFLTSSKALEKFLENEHDSIF